MIDHRAAHHKCPFRFVAPSNILKDKDVAARGKLGLLGTDGLGRVWSTPYGVRTIRNGSGAVAPFGRKNGGVELDAIAHGNHHVLARVSGLMEHERLSADLASMAGAVLRDAIDAGNISFRRADELHGEGSVERRESVFGLRNELQARTATGFHEQPRAVDGNRPNEVGIVVELILSGESSQLIRGNLELWWLRFNLRNSKRQDGQQQKCTEKMMRGGFT